MNGRDRPRIAISCGDPNGIGLEVVFKALTATQRSVDSSGADFEATDFDVALFAPEDVVRRHLAALGLNRPVFELFPDEFESGYETQFGEITGRAGRFSMHSFESAVAYCLEGHADAIVTAPISKESINLAGYQRPGHTEYLAAAAGATTHAMMMVDNNFRVALVTTHIPVSAISGASGLLTQDLIMDKLETLIHALRQDFGILDPRIAVLGLNPHAGEGGHLGTEETMMISPAIQQSGKRSGLEIDGPFPADAFFGMRRQEGFDGVLAMYHDQGLIPFKALSFETGVNYTAGLSIVRTSPDHGTAFDIAGQNKASSASMEAAIMLACDIVRNRASQIN
jgi:4-hydroxythreonine-4-phosphate dehydrogenase